MKKLEIIDWICRALIVLGIIWSIDGIITIVHNNYITCMQNQEMNELRKEGCTTRELCDVYLKWERLK